MSITKSPDNQDISLTHDLLYAARYYLGGRRGLLALAAMALVSGLALNWSWLVAAGIAPFLLGALPCVAMCALGLCMTKMGGKSCSTDAASEKTAQLGRGERSPPALVQKPVTPLERPAKGRKNDVALASSQQPQPAERKKTDA